MSKVMHYKLNGKILENPSFFEILNFGGGAADKSREIVYDALCPNVPILINYFYINNEIPHSFASPLFDNIRESGTIGNAYNNIKDSLINKGYIYREVNLNNFDFNNKVFLLDSGAYNVIKYIAEIINYDTSLFKNKLVEEIHRYYDFANQIKVDMVIAFDLGGKYTKKDNENSNSKLQKFLNSFNSDKINRFILEETIKYLGSIKSYFPKVLATVHGSTIFEYEKSIKYILSLEDKYNYSFWGFALGGVASPKGLHHSWFDGIDFNKTGKKPYKDIVAPARASKLVRNSIGDTRPIHALGCGGYQNIVGNYFFGATSFDAASPSRRVGDGSNKSSKHVFDPNFKKEKFSKYFMGGINRNGKLSKEEFHYEFINLVDDETELCGCEACNNAKNMKNIKHLYSQKHIDDESWYYSRQLMNKHAVNQHAYLCKVLEEYDNLHDFVCDYPSRLNRNIEHILLQI